MPDDSVNHHALQHPEPSAVERALMDRLDAWGRSELHDMRGDQGMSGIPGPMLEDLHRARLLRRTLIGAALAVLGMFLLVLVIVVQLVGSDEPEPSPHSAPAQTLAPVEEMSFRAAPTGDAVQPSLRQLHQLNPDPSIETLVLPGPMDRAESSSQKPARPNYAGAPR